MSYGLGGLQEHIMELSSRYINLLDECEQLFKQLDRSFHHVCDILDEAIKNGKVPQEAAPYPTSRLTAEEFKKGGVYLDAEPTEKPSIPEIDDLLDKFIIGSVYQYYCERTAYGEFHVRLYADYLRELRIFPQVLDDTINRLEHDGVYEAAIWRIRTVREKIRNICKEICGYIEENSQETTLLGLLCAPEEILKRYCDWPDDRMLSE